MPPRIHRKVPLPLPRKREGAAASLGIPSALEAKLGDRNGQQLTVPAAARRPCLRSRDRSEEMTLAPGLIAVSRVRLQLVLANDVQLKNHPGCPVEKRFLDIRSCRSDEACQPPNLAVLCSVTAA